MSNYVSSLFRSTEFSSSETLLKKNFKLQNLKAFYQLGDCLSVYNWCNIEQQITNPVAVFVVFNKM